MEFKLRPWKETDIDSLVKHANNIKIAKYMTDQFPHPYNKNNAIAFITMASKPQPATIMAIEVSGEAAGGIGVHLQQDIFRKNAEMGYWLSEQYWGKGIITAAIQQMVQYAFENFDIDRIFARPFGSNLASQRALLKAGFILEGKFEKTILKNGEFEDEFVYALRK